MVGLRAFRSLEDFVSGASYMIWRVRTQSKLAIVQVSSLDHPAAKACLPL